MKHSSLISFEQALQTTDQPSTFLYTILCKETFHRQKAFQLILNSFLAINKEISSDTITSFDGEKFDSAAFIDEILSLSFFSKNKIIHISNFDKLSKTEIEKIESHFTQLPLHILLVISAAALASNTKIYKLLEKTGLMLDLPEEKSWEKEKKALEWLIQEVSSRNFKMEMRAAQALVKQIGPDYTLLEKELEKLICYTFAKKEITVKDVSEISVQVSIETVWQLGEAIFQRNSAKALIITKNLLNSGTVFLTLLRQIRNQFQTEFQVCSLLAQGEPLEAISRSFPYMKGRILEQHVGLAQNYGIERFRQAMIVIDEHELMAKNSPIEQDFIAQRLILKLTL